MIWVIIIMMVIFFYYYIKNKKRNNRYIKFKNENKTELKNRSFYANTKKTGEKDENIENKEIIFEWTNPKIIQTNNNSNEKNYYVYFHKDKDDNIFYIGKGKNRRAWKKTGRHTIWKYYVDKYLEGEYAVLLIRPEEEEKIDWPVSFLSEDVEEGDILDFKIEKNYGEKESDKEKIKELIEQLKD